MTEATDSYASAVTLSFGDSPEQADELLALVLAGKKTATCGSLRQFAPIGAETMPEVGRRDVVLDGKGRRAAVIETLQLEIKRYDEVDPVFASEEGEGDLSLGTWRVNHQAFFEGQGSFAPDMLVVCERFRLVEVLPARLEGCEP